jgi:hypothetical protein
MKLPSTFIAMAGLLAATALAHASPTITGLSPSAKNAPRGQALTFTIRGEGLEEAICALRVNYGDGSSVVRHMDWGKRQRFPLSLQKTYAKAGKYSVSVVGIKSGKVLKCLGGGHASVLITEAPVAP